MNQNVYTLALYNGLNLQELRMYVGDDGEIMAKEAFQANTGISYDEYTVRRIDGEGNAEILSEDDEGNEIYVFRLQDATNQGEEGVPLWVS